MAQVILYVPAMVGVNSKTTVCPFVNTSTFFERLGIVTLPMHPCPSSFASISNRTGCFAFTVKRFGDISPSEVYVACIT